MFLGMAPGIVKATSHLTIFMHGMRAKGKIQRNDYQYEQRRPSVAGTTSSLSLIAYLLAPTKNLRVRGTKCFWEWHLE